MLKKYLLEFNSPVGRHTGEMIGKDLVATIQKFGFEKKVCKLFLSVFKGYLSWFHSLAGWWVTVRV